MSKCIMSRLILSCAILALVFTFFSCNTGSSSDGEEDPASNKPETPAPETPAPESPEAAAASLVKGIYTGTYDDKPASFICSGTECVIAVDSKTYAKGTFTDLATASASARTVGFVANLTITEKVNSEGILCAVAEPEKITFAFPPEGSTEPITITVGGVAQDITREVTYTVTFDHKNGQYSEVPVKAGTELKLDDPIYNSIAKGNFSLMDWCLDKECTSPAPNPLIVDENMTLYAKWEMVSLAAPAVTDVSDGISISVDMMPENNGGLQFFKIEADGSWNSLYYRGSGEENYKAPILYPFVEPGKAYRFVIEFYDQNSHALAVTNQFTAIPAHGVGEISVSNVDAIKHNITDDGKYSMTAAPEFIGKGASSIQEAWAWFEFWKGTGWESQTFTWITGSNMPTSEITTQHDMFINLISNPSVPLPSGSKFFVNFVLKVKYGNAEYRVLNCTSEVHTITYDERWRAYVRDSMYGDTNTCVYTLEKTETGAKIIVTSNPDADEIELCYNCDSTRGKSCTYTVTVKNTSAVTEYVSFEVRGSDDGWYNYEDIPAGSEMTFSINNDEEKVVSRDGFLYVDVEGGSFEISNPTVTLNE